jgi:lipopolysaccharide transport system ATP-binding protein
LSDTVIKVENLGKHYRLGQTAGYNTLRDTISSSYHRVFHRQPGQDQQEHEYIWALKDVSFEIKRGEAVGIIGRNGSGKSTLLKILSRIVTPTEGYAEIHGRTGSLLEVGTGFHPELSGRENIFLNGAVLGMKKTDINRKLEEIVTFSEIGDFLDTPVKRYSSGMYVRLAFAVAAHLEPDILLLDEVLAVGDTQFQKKCLDKMNDVTKEGRTIVFVSHNMTAVQELCPKSLLFSAGHIIQEGITREVASTYLSVNISYSIGTMDISSASLRQNSLPNSLFHWTRISILNFTGQKTSLLRYREPFEIIIQGKADTALSGIRAGFSIDSLLGICICNSFQIDHGISDKIPEGLVTFRIKMDPNLLAPGDYKISLGANGQDVIDYLPVTIPFRILGISKENHENWQGHNMGLIYYPCSWSLIPDSN